MPDPIDDDVFDYDNGFSQCISGHGRDLVEDIGSVVSDAYCGRLSNREERVEELRRLEYKVKELVRWCRHLNGELKRAKAGVSEALAKAKS